MNDFVKYLYIAAVSIPIGLGIGAGLNQILSNKEVKTDAAHTISRAYGIGGCKSLTRYANGAMDVSINSSWGLYGSSRLLEDRNGDGLVDIIRECGLAARLKAIYTREFDFLNGRFEAADAELQGLLRQFEKLEDSIH